MTQLLVSTVVATALLSWALRDVLVDHGRVLRALDDDDDGSAAADGEPRATTARSVH